MRILHVAESVKGGCGTYLNQIVPCQLAAPEIEAVRVIVPQGHASQMASIPMEDLRLFMSNGRSLRGMVALFNMIRSELRSFNPDIVHLHSSFAGLVGRLMLGLPPRRRRALIYCAHGWGFDIQGSAARQRTAAFIERIFGGFADRIVTISDYERQRGLDIGIPEERMITIANGLADLGPPPPATPAGFPRQILFVGRLDKQKGFDTLLEAARDMEGKIALRVIGAPVVGDQEIAGNLPSHITLLGWRTEAEIHSEMLNSSLVVIPSRWEGFGLVALEAMRAGRAVVASNVGGLPQVVDDGVTGRLVSPNNPAALRAAMLQLPDEELVRMGAAGRARYLEHFTVDRTVEGLKQLYRSCLNAQ